MNAAFLLVTSAWLAGQATAPPPAKPLPPPVYGAPAPVAGAGCAGCGETGGAECCGRGGFLARLRALCHRHEGCEDCGGGCASAPCAPAPPPKPAPAPCAAPSPCAAPAACGGCEQECGCGGGFLARLRALCHRRSCCEEGAADCCGAAGPCAPGVSPLPPRPPEPLKAPKGGEAPKEMPKGTTNGAGVFGPQSVVTPATTLFLDR